MMEHLDTAAEIAEKLKREIPAKVIIASNLSALRQQIGFEQDPTRRGLLEAKYRRLGGT